MEPDPLSELRVFSYHLRLFQGSHDPQMEKIFEVLTEPKSLDELNLPGTFVKDLILKIIANHNTVKTSRINEITGLHWDVIKESLTELEKDGFCAPVSGGFLFSSIEYSVTKKGREKSRAISEDNPYMVWVYVLELQCFINENRLKGYIIWKRFKEVFIFPCKGYNCSCVHLHLR